MDACFQYLAAKFFHYKLKRNWLWLYEDSEGTETCSVNKLLATVHFMANSMTNRDVEF